ncbi:LysR family transcriptional regulator [Geopsychrobacter electrodiphilus]|uniref:LysR family transcriptional regulator n=1 Tax=Geopsychrobacter electrodiphilus TaxID=225196 RepID=UPI000376F202|nr:LysR family transcriptional regulator [Geopsychrobacter electrodiphilus]
MNWDDMRFFLAVARTGSISGGAKQLEVQHSTVSRRLRALEETLGTRLIERKKTGYELTPAGEHIKQSAIRVEREMLGVDEALLGKDAALAGPLHVSALNNMASSILMPMFARFSEKHPQVEVHINVSNVDASLAQREADVAIRLTNAPIDTLIGKRMLTVASTIYGNRDYLNNIKQQAGEPKWIGVNCCLFHKTWTKQTCSHQSHNFYSNDTLLTLGAIREGLGVSYLPCFMGDSDPLLQRYSEPDPQHDLGLWILLHSDLKRTARVLSFRDHMIRSIQEKRDLFEGKLADEESGRVLEA